MTAASVGKGLPGSKEIFFRSAASAKRFRRFFLCLVFALVLRQSDFSRQANSVQCSKGLNTSDGPLSTTSGVTIPVLGPVPVPVPTPTPTPTRRTIEGNASTVFEGAKQILFHKKWKSDIELQLEREEETRLGNVDRNSSFGKFVRGNFDRLKKRLKTVRSSEIDDPQNWHAVTPEGYSETLQKARSSMDELVDQVYIDCVLWLVPNPAIASREVVEIDDRNEGPLLKFQCGNNKNDNTETETENLQDEPCRSANLCLVRSDPLQWRSYYSNRSYSNNNKNNNKNNTSNTSNSSGNTTATSHYNHTDLFRRFLTPNDDDSTGRPSKSAIITMVDTIHYLRSGKEEKLGFSFFIWECFLNKASYALRTNRDLYIWIGGFQGDKDGNSTTSTLHQRNTETVSRTFGANCMPEIADKNVVHYYKPIAFGALFRKLRSQRQHRGEGDHKAWFVDADIFFNKEAFHVPFPGNNASGDSASIEEPISLDDYFDISPQAALLGSQNPSGKDDNILINGGLLGLRGTATVPSDPLDDWVLNLSSLWWYCRCGERDQIALWLLLFATWSAESGGNDAKKKTFAYPSVVLENYMFSWFAVAKHSQVFLPKLLSTWTNETNTNSDTNNGSAGWGWTPKSKLKSKSKSAWTTVPTDAGLFDGGNFSNSGTYTYPLELPHVLLIPLDPFELPLEPLSSSSTTTSAAETSEKPRPLTTLPPPRSDFSLSLIRKYQNEKKALLTHTKDVDNVCYDFMCWPYLTREGPKSVRHDQKKEEELKNKKKEEKKLVDAEIKRKKEIEKKEKEKKKKKKKKKKKSKNKKSEEKTKRVEAETKIKQEIEKKKKKKKKKKKDNIKTETQEDKTQEQE